MSGHGTSLAGGQAFEKLGLRAVSLLLVLQLFLLTFLWSLDPLGKGAQTLFPMYLAANMILFAMISYVYRSLKRDGRFGKVPLIAGCAVVCVLLLVGLF